jgi:hypothetical protein
MRCISLDLQAETLWKVGDDVDVWKPPLLSQCSCSLTEKVFAKKEKVYVDNRLWVAVRSSGPFFKANWQDSDGVTLNLVTGYAISEIFTTGLVRIEAAGSICSFYNPGVRGMPAEDCPEFCSGSSDKEMWSKKRTLSGTANGGWLVEGDPNPCYHIRPNMPDRHREGGAILKQFERVAEVVKEMADRNTA